MRRHVPDRRAYESDHGVAEDLPRDAGRTRIRDSGLSLCVSDRPVRVFSGGLLGADGLVSGRRVHDAVSGRSPAGCVGAQRACTRGRRVPGGVRRRHDGGNSP